MKKITVTACIHCPIADHCKAWNRELSAEESELVLTGILSDCPLEDNITQQDIHVIQSNAFQAGINEATSNLHKL